LVASSHATSTERRGNAAWHACSSGGDAYYINLSFLEEEKEEKEEWRQKEIKEGEEREGEEGWEPMWACIHTTFCDSIILDIRGSVG